MSQSLASITGAVKRFGKVTALDGFDLDVRRGELLALLGPNGAGKSTAISLMLGLQRPDAGEVTLFGEDPQELDARRRIGIMMQEVMLSPVMRSRELIEQITNYYPSPYEAAAVIRRLGIESLAERRYKDLSGGQKRQVQFAMAICGRPELLFLDEPTVGLDVNARAALWQVVRELVHEGASIVLTTHYIEEAEAIADRIGVINKGRIVLVEEKAALMQKLGKKQLIMDLQAPLTALPPSMTGYKLELSGGGSRLTYTYDAHVDDAGISALLRDLGAAGVHFTDLKTEQSSLEDIFVTLVEEAA